MSKFKFSIRINNISPNFVGVFLFIKKMHGIAHAYRKHNQNFPSHFTGLNE